MVWLSSPSATSSRMANSRWGEQGERAVRRCPAHLGQLGHRLGQRVVEHDVAGGDRPQGVLDALRSGALDQVAAGPVAQRRERRVVVLRHRQHDHLDRRMVGGEPAVDVEPGPVDQAHVEQHDVRRGRRHERRDLVGALGLPDELDALHLVDGGRQAHPEHGVIVDDGDPQPRRPGSHGRAAGRRTWTCVPRGSCGERDIDPPSSTARSLIAVSPTPAVVSSPMPMPSSTTSISTVGPVAMVSQQLTAPGVTHDVGHGLGDDAVRGHLDRGRQLDRRRRQDQVDLQIVGERSARTRRPRRRGRAGRGPSAAGRARCA